MYTQNKIDNVVIVAGGLNTRMEDLSVFPKVLFPIPNFNSILTYDVKEFEKKNIYLVINSTYYEMVSDYCKRNNLSNVNIIKSTNTNGSTNTLREVSNHLPNKNTLLVWSDLIIANFSAIEEAIKQTKSNFVVFTRQGEYRFKAFNGEDKKLKLEATVPSSKEGNVPGIYFYKEIPDFSIIGSKDNYDFVEMVRDYFADQAAVCDTMCGLVEFRDKKTFKDLYVNDKFASFDRTDVTRFFNKMSIDPVSKKVYKSCHNPEYKHLIEKEAKWYDKVKSVGFDGIPTVYDSYSDDVKSSITLEYLDGYVTASEFAKSHSQEEIKAMVEKIVSKADELHKTTIPVQFLDVQEDYEEEFVGKVLRRCDSIKDMLVKYDRDELERLLTKAFNILYHDKCKVGVMPNTTYTLIHGDLNGSNVMYNETTGDVKFIDPRGYFGKSKMFGPEEYDFAKILYFLSGYDIFNKSRVVYNDWKFDWECVLNADFIPDKLNQWTLRIIVGIIWIALAQYIAQDIMKANLAYEHGVALLKEELVTIW